MSFLYSLGNHPIASVLYGALLIWMIFDSVREQNTMWIWIMLIVQPFGLLAYLLICKFPEWNVTDRLNRIFFGGYRLRELKAKIHHMDLPYHRVQLGHEYRLTKKWTDAEREYEKALQQDQANDDAKYGLGLCKLELGQAQAGLELLHPLVEKNPRYEHGSALIGAAHCYLKMGMKNEARQAYEWALEFYTYPQVQYEYGKLLLEMGDAEKGRALLARLVEDGRNATGFKVSEERRWGRRARVLLKRSAA